MNRETITPETAKSAMTDVMGRLYRIEMGLLLLKEIEDGTVVLPNDGNGVYTYNSVALEYIWNAYKGLFDSVDQLHDYVQQEARS